MPCYCSNCSKEPLPTYTEAQRNRCEIIHLSKRFKTEKDLLRYLSDMIENRNSKRGKDEANMLYKEVKKLWRDGIGGTG